MVEQKKLTEFALQNIISLYSFVAVLAIHNSIRIFVEARSANVSNGAAQSPLNGPFMEWAPFLITLVLIFRYFLGDLMFLRKYQEHNLILRVPDFLNVLINAILLAYLSFFVNQPAELYKLILILFALDVLWWLSGWLVGLGARNVNEIDASIGISILVSAVKLIFFALLFGAIIYFELDQEGSDPGIIEVISSLLKFEFSSKVLVIMTWFFIADAVLDSLIRGRAYLGILPKKSGR